MADTRLRITKIDELQLLTCLKHGVWGSQFPRFADWQPGDHLAFIVDKALAAVAQVAGKPFTSKQVVWENAVYPYRLPLKFLNVITPADRPPILGAVRDALTSAWGTRYGFGILNQHLLTAKPAEVVLSTICSRPNALVAIQANLEGLMAEAKAAREAKQHKAKGKGRPKQSPAPKAAQPIEQPQTGDSSLPVATREEPQQAGEERAHSRYQSLLIQLGKVTGCTVWIAASDKSKLYNGKVLGDGCLKALPSMGLSTEATERISLIDIIWVQKNAPVCAFEVETTTQVFSGLLRMSDLLALVPALNVKLYIVAPRERQGKVMRELGRPTFQKIGLSEYCRYLPGEELQELAKSVHKLSGHVHTSV